MNKEEQHESAKTFFQRFSVREDWLVLDTETTGPDENEDEIVEIAILTATGYRLVDVIVSPSVPIKEGAAEVHGITNEDVESKPHLSAFPQIPWLLKHHPLLIYNKDFDIPIIENSLKQWGFDPEVDDWTALCVMEAYAAACGSWDEHHESYTWVKLEKAVEEQGIPTDGIQLHRAAGDAELTRRLVKSFQ